jgi:hypothetical protein
VGLEWGLLSPCEDKEELLERKLAAPVLKTEINNRNRSTTDQIFCIRQILEK